MNKEDRAFFDSCDSYKNYENIDEYKKDIRRWLTLSSWHYTEEQADELMAMKERTAWIEQAFDNKEPVADIAADVGYCCG